MKKKCFIILLVVLLVFMGTGNLLAADEIKVYVDGGQLSFPDQKPFINSDNRTLVPVRFVSEGLGAEVNWNGANQQVSVRLNGKTILLNIGVNKAKVDGTEVVLDTSASLVNSRTMVPLRFVSECLGAEVRWSATDYAVYITTADRAKDEALIDSDLQIKTPPPGDVNDVNLKAVIYYTNSKPVEPQIADLQKILERRFTTEEIKPVVDYIKTKQAGVSTRIPTKDWTINGKLVRVNDEILAITVTVWN